MTQPQLPSPQFYRIRICGEAGEGISTAGDLLLCAAVRHGLHATCVKYLSSNIRGGLAESLVTLGTHPTFSPTGVCDLLVVVSTNAGIPELACLGENGVVLMVIVGKDGAPSDKQPDWLLADNHRVIPIPVSEIIPGTTGSATSKTIAVLGVVGQLLRIDIGHLIASINARFGGLSAGEVDANLRVAAAAYGWATRHLGGCLKQPVTPLPASPVVHENMLVIDGNQAIALGAFAAGCTFFASYPITPATTIGETLARLLPQRGGCAYQAEDEMAALGAVVGASFAGVKAFTATSGPGLSLMQEFIGYASMTEIPAVIVDVQRVGPSTGMPTRHGQDDLLAAVFGGHGEGPRIVLAPHCVEDCFTSTILAFNCAEKYQCPVIVLSDAALGLMKKNVHKAALSRPDIVERDIVVASGDFAALSKRYCLPGSGCSPMPVPGKSSVTYRITGVEHTEDGAVATTSQERLAQVEKRSRKLRGIESELDGAVEWDLAMDEGCGVDIGVITWGFTVAATRDAVARLRCKGYRIAGLYPRLLYPLCTTAISRWAAMCPLQIVVEANSTGQYCSLVGMVTATHPKSVALSSGEPFTPEEIINGILRHVSHKGGAA